MATRVLLTVDTELAWRHFSHGAGWKSNFARSVDPANVGLSYQLATLERHGLTACFFVDPMPALLYGPDPVLAMVSPVVEAGQEVQLHLHSFWSDLADGRTGPQRFELTAFGEAKQRALIARARALLLEAGAPHPIAFRSGSYAADENTLTALRELGFRFDSSHNGAECPWPSALPFPAAMIAPREHLGVTEIPVSVIRNRRGALRPLQICALSSGEMEAALRHADANDHPVVVIVSHSFELASRDANRINRTVRKRFDRLCAFLAERRAAMPTVRFSDLDALPLDRDASPMTTSIVRATRRMAEQLWSNVRYERQGLALGAIGCAPPAALDHPGIAHGA